MIRAWLRCVGLAQTPEIRTVPGVSSCCDLIAARAPIDRRLASLRAPPCPIGQDEPGLALAHHRHRCGLLHRHRGARAERLVMIGAVLLRTGGLPPCRHSLGGS